MIAFGLFFSGENSYLRNPTNLLDFFITTLSVSYFSLIFVGTLPGYSKL